MILLMHDFVMSKTNPINNHLHKNTNKNNNYIEESIIVKSLKQQLKL